LDEGGGELQGTELGSGERNHKWAVMRYLLF
jgi:hypothetical protein